MPIQGALYCREKSPVRIEIDSPAALREAVGTGRLPGTVVVRVAELKLFGECEALFKNRRKKDEHKGLSEYLLGQSGRIPFIDVNVTATGRLRQAVERLLENAEQTGEQGIYLLGVSGEIFQEVWRGALRQDAVMQPASRANGLAALITPLPGEAQLSRFFWGESEAYHEVRQLILRAAKCGDPVLILGEAGTGKGVVARAIHELGEKDKPFIEVNCAAIPSELFELELFGYAAGAIAGGLSSSTLSGTKRVMSSARPICGAANSTANEKTASSFFMVSLPVSRGLAPQRPCRPPRKTNPTPRCCNGGTA